MMKMSMILLNPQTKVHKNLVWCLQTNAGVPVRKGKGIASEL